MGTCLIKMRFDINIIDMFSGATSKKDLMFIEAIHWYQCP